MGLSGCCHAGMFKQNSMYGLSAVRQNSGCLWRFNCIYVFLSLFCMPVMLKLFFVYTQFEDQTAMFLSFVSKRHVDFSAKKDRHVRVIGQDAFDSLQYFYTAVKSVFEKGLTGGCRIIATKPALN